MVVTDIIDNVRGLELGLDYLDSDEATLDVSVPDHLNEAVINPFIGHLLVILPVVVLQEIFYELVRLVICLLFHREVLVEKEFILLSVEQTVLKFCSRFCVDHRDYLNAVLELH